MVPGAAAARARHEIAGVRWRLAELEGYPAHRWEWTRPLLLRPGLVPWPGPSGLARDVRVGTAALQARLAFVAEEQAFVVEGRG